MEELNYKDLTEKELDTLKDMYISSRVNSMTESDLREFVKEIIIDQIKGTVGNAEEKEAWEEIKDHFHEDFNKKILDLNKISFIYFCSLFSNTNTAIFDDVQFSNFF